MPEDKIDIDSKKFETEAFSAIDKLLPEESENEEETLKKEISSGIDETLSKKTEEGDSLLRLDKALLGLDWEVSDSVLQEFLDMVEGLKRVYPDEVSYALLSMMNTLVKFLTFARHMSPPGTIKLIAKIADVFKEINTSTLSLEERKLRVQKIYDEFSSFKKEAEKVKKEEVKISPMLGEELSNLKAEFFVLRENFDQLQSKLSQATDNFTHQSDILEKINVKSENFSCLLEKVIKEIAGLKVNIEEIEKSILPLPQVLVAFIDSRPVAFPERCVANVYKISLSKAKEIRQRDHITLGEIACICLSKKGEQAFISSGKGSLLLGGLSFKRLAM